MEDLLRRVRSKVSGKEEIGSFREGRTQPQRTPSFRGERKPEKWLKRQFSRQMSNNHSIEEAQYAAAVAAAAFAITALDSDVMDHRKPEPERRPSLPRMISGLISSAFTAEHDEPQKYYSDENDDEAARMVPEKTIHPVPSIKRNPSMPKKRLTFADELAEDPNKHSVYETPHFVEDEFQDAEGMKFSTPSFGRSPSAKKAPSFGEKEFEDAGRRKPVSNTSFKRTPKKTPSFSEEIEELRRMKSPKRPGPQPILPPPPPAVPPLNIQPMAPPKGAHRPRDPENDADAWETEQMAKIKQRYEKLNETIMDWEDKKKKKARRKLEMTERDPEKKRVKAMHNYQMEMERIKKIADGARAQAKEKRRNDEMKVREKASRYRATGERPQPPTCLCL
ncbi:hypothetical protein RND81_11G046000 [Saponaria officinalis]|uniref:Remorin C-terminal domain-containing protein n=1 Tax=Saponaria officinalis TaxID=3572 RepID=A0AAW1HI55_SAPOF